VPRVSGAFVSPTPYCTPRYCPKFSRSTRLPAADRIAQGLGTVKALDGLSDRYDHTGNRRPLRDLGLSREGINAVADSVLATVPPPNPRPVDLESVRHLLAATWGAPWQEVADPANSRPAT
jgi:alcohol dehydrogenase class IV